MLKPPCTHNKTRASQRSANNLNSNSVRVQREIQSLASRSSATIILPGAAFIFVSRTFEPVCDTGSQRSVLRTADHIYTAINNLPEDMLKRAGSTSDFQITSPTVRRSERNRTVQHVSAVCTNKWENETCASKSVTVTLRIQ